MGINFDDILLTVSIRIHFDDILLIISIRVYSLIKHLSE